MWRWTAPTRAEFVFRTTGVFVDGELTVPGSSPKERQHASF